jgi:hypothetical protein
LPLVVVARINRNSQYSKCEGKMVRKVGTKELSQDALLTIVACIIGVAGVVFELGWIGRALLVVFAVGLTIFAARRHRAHLAWRAVIATLVTVILVALSARPIWEDFHKKYPLIVFRSPISFSGGDVPRDPPDMPPLNLVGPPLSKMGKVMYLCPMPPQVDPAERAAVREALRKNAEIFGNALSLSMVWNDIPYGIRFDVTSNGSAEGQANMGGLATRFTVQLEAASQGIFVTIFMNMGAMGILEAVGLERDSGMEKMWRKLAEQMTMAPEGKCRLL